MSGRNPGALAMPFKIADIVITVGALAVDVEQGWKRQDKPDDLELSERLPESEHAEASEKSAAPDNVNARYEGIALGEPSEQPAARSSFDWPFVAMVAVVAL